MDLDFPIRNSKVEIRMFEVVFLNFLTLETDEFNCVNPRVLLQG